MQSLNFRMADGMWMPTMMQIPIQSAKFTPEKAVFSPRLILLTPSFLAYLHVRQLVWIPSIACSWKSVGKHWKTPANPRISLLAAAPGCLLALARMTMNNTDFLAQIPARLTPTMQRVPDFALLPADCPIFMISKAPACLLIRPVHLPWWRCIRRVKVCWPGNATLLWQAAYR